MSRRTSEANKAISAAWANEQQLVREGKGTRDWTLEQQQDILDRGKVYDDNGKAFEGHHMKSAEKFSEYQGNPQNIQFLSRSEHFNAHKGNFQNPTNGFYNPCTGITNDFGPDIYKPCEIIELSKPILIISDNVQVIDDGTETVIKDNTDSERPDSTPLEIKDLSDKNKGKPTKVKLQVKSGNGLKHYLGKVADFCVRHKDEIFTAIKIGGTLAAGYAAAKNNQNETSSTEVSSGNGDFATAEEDIERSSPREHFVSGYDRQQNGKTVHVSPYPRGRNRND